MNYTKESLCAAFAGVNWNMGKDGVQEYWNAFKNNLINKGG
jgi:hypothetical protein